MNNILFVMAISHILAHYLLTYPLHHLFWHIKGTLIRTEFTVLA